MFFKNKKGGFTLSEVMITMTMIGVLATLTISTIGASIQKRARLSEFRAAYAKMDAAFHNITADLGRAYVCYNVPSSTETDNQVKEYGLNIAAGTTAADTECALLTQDFTRAMGAIRKCEYGKLITNGCLPDNYPGFAEGNDHFSKLKYDEENLMKGYVLDNSMILIIHVISKELVILLN